MLYLFLLAKNTVSLIEKLYFKEDIYMKAVCITLWSVLVCVVSFVAGMVTLETMQMHLADKNIEIKAVPYKYD